MRKKYDILVYAMSSYFEWRRGVVNRNRQVMEHLLGDPRIGRVLMVDFLPFNRERKAREYFYSRIFFKDFNTIAKGWDYKLNREKENFFVLSTISYKRVELSKKKLDFNRPIVWSYNPLDTRFLDEESRVTVFDAVDHWAYHPAYRNQANRLLSNYKKIQEKADVIFTVSEVLKNELFQGREDARWVPNGVDWEHYQKREKARPDDLKGIPQPIAGYVGVIQERFDIKLVQKLANLLPRYSFVFIGPIWKKTRSEIRQKLSGLANVYFLGAKPYQSVPDYLSCFKVGLIPHKNNRLTRSMDPMKIYEYLACGLPVVSTPVACVGELEAWACFEKDSEKIAEDLKNAVEKDNKEKRTQRRDFIKNHSWEKRVRLMMRQILKNMAM